MTAYYPNHHPSRPRFKPTLASLPTLDQYLLLSMLVHVLVILLFGDTGAGAPGGKRIWGAMNVTLQSLLPRRAGDEGPVLRTDTRLASLERRGARYAGEPAVPAAALPPPQPVESTPPPAIGPRSGDAAFPSPPSPALSTPVPAESPPPTPPAPRFIAKDVEKATSDFVVPPAAPVNEAPAEAPAYRAPLMEPVAPVKIEHEVAVPAQIKLREQPAIVPPVAPLAPMAPSPSERQYVPRANALPRLTPMAPPAATTVQEKIERQLTTPVAPLPQLSPVPVPKAISTVPTKIDRELTTPVAPLPQLAPVAAPPALNTVPATIDRELTTPSPPLPPLAPIAAPAVISPAPTKIDRELAVPSPALPQLTPISPPAAITATPARIEREFVPPVAPAAASAAGGLPPDGARPATAVTDRAEQGAPVTRSAGEGAADAGLDKGAARGGRDAALPSGTAAPGTKLDLDAIRQRARSIAAEGTGPRTVLPFPTAPAPPAKTNAQKAFDKLKRPDCKDAYSSLGLAAVVPLLVDSVREDGCKW